MISAHSFSVNLVTGPPLAGKTSYVLSNMTPGDLVVDQDAIAAALSYSAMHEDHLKNIKFAWRMMDEAITQLALGSTEPNHIAWLVGCFRTTRLQAMTRILRPQRIIVIATDEVACLDRLRLEKSSRPRHRLATSIRTWWNEFEPIAGAEVIR